MRTMNICIAIGFGLCVISGCGRMVGKMEYIDNSMSTRYGAMTETAPPRAPAYHRTIPVEGFHLPDLYFDETYYDDDDDRAHVPSAQHIRALISFTRAQLNVLGGELIRISALADQNGAAGRAAYDPYLRSFTTTTKLIERVLLELQSAPHNQWQGLMHKVEVYLEDAKNAVREAEANVRSVTDRGHVLSMNSN